MSWFWDKPTRWLSHWVWTYRLYHVIPSISCYNPRSITWWIVIFFARDERLWCSLRGCGVHFAATTGLGPWGAQVWAA
jgi:hypothetical protein